MRLKLTQFISNPLGQALGLGGFGAQCQSTEYGWDSRPYLVKFLVRSSLFDIRYSPRLAKLADSLARPSGFLDSRCRAIRIRCRGVMEGSFGRTRPGYRLRH